MSTAVVAKTGPVGTAAGFVMKKSLAVVATIAAAAAAEEEETG